MTALQKLTLRSSEIRTRLSEIATTEGDLSDEQRSELTALKSEYQDVETRSQALMLAGDDPEPKPANDAEGRELRSLIAGANLGDIYDAALEKRNIDGETRELQEHYGLGANQVPLDLLETRSFTPELETRAFTPAPSNAGRTQAEIVQPVFAQGAAAFLGIPTPRVPVGDRVYPVLTTRASVKGPFTDDTAADETTGAFAADTLAPSRIQASFFYRRTDAARFGSMDSALRSALSASLMEKHDYEILRGTAGLFTGTNLAANASGSAAWTFPTYLSKLGFGRVDGRYANTLGDLRVLVGSATYGHMGSVYNDPAADNAAGILMGKLAGMRVTAHAPAPASDKQNAIVRLGMRRDAVSPIWEGVTLIPDEITKAAKGEIVLTAVMLFAMKILRAGGFHKQETKHA